MNVYFLKQDTAATHLHIVRTNTQATTLNGNGEPQANVKQKFICSNTQATLTYVEQ